MYLWQMNGATLGLLDLRRAENTNFVVAGVADFTGDAKADILLRNSATARCTCGR